MPQNEREYRILDKDLGRVTHAEHAALASARPMVRLGLALVFIAAAAEFAAAALAGQPALGIMAASVAVAIYLALSIGANDVSNALSPAVGSGAISLGVGLVLVALMDVLGAVMAGGAVTRTLTEGLMGDTMGQGTPTAKMMLAALVGAATWISVATRLNAPVSTTHSVVGAIAGAGIATFGFGAVNWGAMAIIAMGWVVSPIISGLLAALILSSMHHHVLDKDDPIPSGRRWLTALVAATAGLLVAMAAVAFQDLGWRIVALLGLLGAGLGAAYAHVMLGRQIRRDAGQKTALKNLLGVPLVAAALVMGFGHGANDTSNIAAPLTIILQNISDGQSPLLDAQMILLLSGMGIAVGILLFGSRLVSMVGSRITRLNPARALCISLATALTVLAFSLAGLPVSTTHVSVGGVFGVGFYREWRDRQKARKRAPMPDEELRRRHLVRRSHVRTILGAWLITVPVNAALAAALVLGLGL
ncbi:inorganic phosphate transporter [Paracoccus litorisediminis]|uniref:Phosphate transporter n=1 Tax=Paracoccus litorisediminis TaxID=2006130 RepID=A0A844HGM6_9RHOB|nr:inorganic phosphate transporter [Paracoccus litorisediminis]MTH58906.1 inorganic phosphate transporter [Paracoccus litorisediminis]